MKRFVWVIGLFLSVCVNQGWAEPYEEFLDAPTLPAMYGKQAEIKTPQKVFRLAEFDAQNHVYPLAQVSIGGKNLEFSIIITSPYLGSPDGGKELGAFMPIYFVFKNSGSETITFDINTSTWKFVTVGADKLLYANPLVKLAVATDDTFRNVRILWEASPKDYGVPEVTMPMPLNSAAVIVANFDISHALKVAQETTQGRTLPQMFLVVGDAVAYEIPPYTLPRSGPDKAAVDRIVENVEKAMGGQ